MKEIEEELENQEQDGEFFGKHFTFHITNDSNEKIVVKWQVFAIHVEKKLQVQQKLVKLWETCTTLVALSVAPVAGPWEEKPFIMFMVESTVKKIIW